MKNFLTNSPLVRKIYFLVFWLPNKNYKYFLTTIVMKVVEEDISEILARAEITESTLRLSVKKQKEVFLPLNNPSVHSAVNTNNLV